MERKQFNVKEWLDASDTIKPIEPTKNQSISSDKYQEVIQVVEQLEARKMDITQSYEDWRNIGFALADGFGEEGRELYHRISQFYPEYSPTECDKQYNQCLKARGTGINLSSFFYLAKNAGISIVSKPHHIRESIQEMQSMPTESVKLPTLPESLFPQLPDFLQRICKVAETNEERDILLLGSLVTLSSCMPVVYGIYHNKKVFANLFLFVSAQASAGKGRLNHCRQLVKPIHDNLKELSRMMKQQYEVDMAEYNTHKKKHHDLEKPKEPPLRLLFIPANSSASGAFQLLGDNEGRGLLFETEGDTLANTFKSDFGNYSDGFRKAFHHEVISYYRKTDKELIDIENPCLSAMLSGTPKQVLNLIPSAEDGLFSRFMFYYMNMQQVWADVFATATPTGLDDYFYSLGKEFYTFYDALSQTRGMQFVFTTAQQNAFTDFFTRCFQYYTHLKGEEYIGSVRRLGLITYRIAMILSTIRLMETGELPDQLVCDELDFRSAIAIAEILVQHAAYIFTQLPDSEQPMRQPDKRERFYEALPQTFSRQGYLDAATQLGIKDKTAQGYITAFVKGGLLHRDEKDFYIKPQKPSQNTT